MTRPRLAILAPFKAWGGIERKIMILCHEFLALGVQPQLILTRGGVVPYPDELPKEVEIVDLGSGGKLDSVMKLTRFLKHERPAALLTAKDHSAKVAILSRILSRTDVPIFVKITNTLSFTLRRPMKRRSARWLYGYADRLIAVSGGVRDDLIENFGIPPEKVQVIYNPTVTPSIAERKTHPVDHPWLQGDGPPVIIGVGRLTPQKDFPMLIRAFAKVRQQREARLIILGDGPLHDELITCAREAGVGDDVDLPGYVSDPIPYLARGSLFALSSRYEGLANVLIEALAAGLPAVATDCPSGPMEILQAGRIGPLVTVGDADALAQAMLDTLDNPPTQETLARGLDRFRSDKVALQYLQVMGIKSSGVQAAGNGLSGSVE
ncbi:glycosyltransferase involved in cell wall biosynthesis [Natronocella acetinitrilica]|uniref:Glycosyltransferase involved in cell wall biosynthesis n=1 Tax=Natronocella acetinitrilica TaxID=414046 RepID=A0AAE3G1A6_9GAMM|nr:glycosyltransferase [Natronocella acetinitrilica]MCP1673960.1 glycosyltransferase involved in cell wall biosynthesis [Natronocella acetinitrilica]